MSKVPALVTAPIAVFAAALTLGTCVGCESQPKAPAGPGENAATLEVTTTPPGATVVVDGKAYGPAPQNIKLRPGQHTLVVRQSGYFTVTEKLFLGARRTQQKTVTLVASH